MNDDGIVRTPYATSWLDSYESDVSSEGEEPRWEVEVERRLVVIDAPTAEDARRESGLIDHEFHDATEEELDEWRQITCRPLSDEDVGTLVRLLAKEQRATARGRAKDYAAAAGLTTRGINSFVLTTEGLAMLRERDIPTRGNEPAPLIDLLIREGLPEQQLESADHYRARVFTELRGKLNAIQEEA